MTCWFGIKAYVGLNKTFFFFVPRKVRFLAMTMSEQARHCSFGLTKTLGYVPIRAALMVFVNFSLQSYGCCLRLYESRSRS